MPTLIRDGQTLFYDDAGKGDRTVVLSHNLLTDHRVFDGLLERLTPHYRVIRPDLRGHGQSRGVAEAFTTKDLGEDLAAILDHAGVQRAVVGGVSLGVCASMALAAKSPRRVDGMILMAATARVATRADALQNGALAAATRAIGMRSWIVGKTLPSLLGKTALTSSPALVNTWRDRVSALAPSDAYHAIRCWNSRPDGAPLLARVRGVPALVVIGDEDAAIPAEQTRELADLFTNATVARVARAGHTIPAEQPDEVARLIASFLG